MRPDNIRAAKDAHGVRCRAAEISVGRAGDAVLSEFPKVERVEILLKKPDAPMSAKFDYVAVEVVRER